MPALVSYWEGTILHFTLNQHTLSDSRQLRRYLTGGNLGVILCLGASNSPPG